MKLEKLKIFVVDKIDIKEYECVEVMFNPNTLKYSKNIQWEGSEKIGEFTKKEYVKIESKKIDITLYFDFTMTENKAFKDYFDYFEFITSERIDINGKDKKQEKLLRLPTLWLVWGDMEGIPLSMRSVYVITSISWTYEMFDRSGNILRAKADINFEEISDDVNVKSNNKNNKKVKHETTNSTQNLHKTE